MDIRHAFAYDRVMRDMGPIQVLTILIRRLETRAAALEGVRMPEYDVTAHELRKFAEMARNARKYLLSKV